MEWANSIGDQRMREDQVVNLTRNWMRNDPDSAARWVNQASLSPELRTKLQAIKQP